MRKEKVSVSVLGNDVEVQSVACTSGFIFVQHADTGLSLLLCSNGNMAPRRGAG